MVAPEWVRYPADLAELGIPVAEIYPIGGEIAPAF